MDGVTVTVGPDGAPGATAVVDVDEGTIMITLPSELVTDR